MAFYFVFWNEDPGENVEKCARHGFSKDDVAGVFERPIKKTVSRTSGRPRWMGLTDDGRQIAVPFEWIDNDTVYPVTADMPSIKRWNDAKDA